MKEKKKTNQSDTDSLRILAKNKPDQSNYDTHLPLAEAGNLKGCHELHVQQENSLSAEQQNHQANLINSISDAVISTDTNFILTGWNKAAEQIYGWQQNEVIGLQAYTILDTVYSDGVTKEEVARQLHEKGCWVGEIVQKRKDGTSIHISSSVTAIKSNYGEITRILAINRDVTARKLAEAEIVKTNERLKLALQASNSGSFDWNIESDTYYWSEELLQVFGMKPDTRPAFETWLNVVHPDDRGIFTTGIQEAMQQGIELVSDYRIVLPDGEIRWIRATGNTIHSNDKPVRMLGLCRDVTRQKIAEEAIRGSEEKFRAIFENNSSALLITAEDTTLVMVNEAFCQLVGCNSADIIGTSWTRLLPTEEMERLKEYSRLRSLNSKSAPDKYEFKFYRNQSELRDGMMFVSVIPGLKRVVGSFLDITESKKTEEALRESENRFRLALKHAPVCVSTQDKELRFIWSYNQRSGKPEEIVGKTDLELFPEDADLLSALKLEVLKTGKEVSKQLWISGNGKKSFLDFYIEPLRNREGAITGIGTASVDLTAMKLSEEALLESAATLNGILNATSESVWLYGTDGKILMGNQTGIDRLGLPADRIIGHSFDELIPKELAKTRGEMMTRAAVLKQPVVLKDERAGMHFEHTFYPVYSSDGDINRIAAFSRDITQRIREEETQATLNRTFAALAKSSQAMARFTDEKLYLHEVCKIIAEDCGFALVWIGFASDDEQKSVHPIANAGFEDGYLDTLQLTWADIIHGRGPTGTTIRTGNMTLCTNMLTDPSFLPWREQALKRGYASSIVFPLKAENKTFGAISIYAREADGFTEDVIKLLSEMTNNTAHGITTIRLRKDRELAEEALVRAYDELEGLVKERTRELEVTNTLLKNEINIRVQQEQSLSRAEEKYRTVAYYTNDWESWLGPDGNFVYMSPSCLEITGYSEEEFLNDPGLYLSITHPEDSGKIKKHFKAKLKRRITDCSFDYRIVRRDGEVRWMGHKCQPVYNSDGKWIGQRGSNRDITERKRAESLLIESQTQLRSLAQKVNEVAEEERIRIAREIHDELGHMLTALKYDLENLTTLTDATAAELKTEMGALINMVKALIDTVRKISTELRPAILDHLGLLPAIEWLISQFRKHTKICCQFQNIETEVQFDKNETTNIFRIMQEILTNIARHAQATRVEISLALKDDCFEIAVSDNGIGFNIENTFHSGAIGLMGIRERAISIGATVDFKSEPNKGTDITLLLPGKSNGIHHP